MQIAPRDIESVLACLKHDGKPTSCTFKNYSLTAEKADNGVVIRWFERGTREPLEAELAYA